MNLSSKSTIKGLAFTLVLAMLLTMVPMLPGVGQVDEVYAAVPECITNDDAGIEVKGNGFGDAIYANGKAITISQGATIGGVTQTCIYYEGKAVTLAGIAEDSATQNAIDGYDLSGYTIYGGANTVEVTSTSITMTGGWVKGIYGGGNRSEATVSSGTAVNINGGTVSPAPYGEVLYVYGGGNYGTVSGGTKVNISGNAQIYVPVYGGGKQSGARVEGSTTVNISGNAQINGTVYGGGNDGTVSGGTAVTISGNAQINNHVYGGGASLGTVSGNTKVTISGNANIMMNVYGGGNNGPVSGGTAVTISDNVQIFDNVFGGGALGTVSGNTKVTISGGTVYSIVYGGGASLGTVSGNTKVTICGNAHINNQVYGGGNSGTVSGGTAVTISGNAQINNQVYGGGALGKVSGSAMVNICGGVVSGDVYGGGASGTVGGNTKVTISGGAVYGSVYGGGPAVAVNGNTEVNISGGTVGTLEDPKAVFGGGNGENAKVSGSAVVNISSGMIYAYVYGGGSEGAVSGSTEVNIIGGTVGTLDYLAAVFGGGWKGSVSGSATVNISSGTVGTLLYHANVYGGGASGTVNGSTEVNISGGMIYAYVYGGGNEENAKVSGSAMVNICGGVVSGDICGGGARPSATVGDTTSVAITGGSIMVSVSPQPTNGSGGFGGNVYKATLTLKDKDGNSANDVPVTDIGSTYGLNGVKTNSNGKIVVYLASGTSISTVNSNSTTYKVSGAAVVVTSDGAATGDFYAVPSPTHSGGGGSSAATSNIIKTDDTKKAETANEGTVKLSSSNASAGTKVTITVDENVSYEAGTPVVKDANGNKVPVTDNGDGTFSFVMPATAITVDTPFEPIFGEKKETPPFTQSVKSKQGMNLNGKDISLGTYNVDGYNFTKLRDLAAVLNGTGSKFGVETGEGRSIILSPGQSYNPVGGELEFGDDMSGTCVVSSWTVTINGIVRYLDVYNIGGNNYFKLRDLGELLDFDVDYDKDTNTALIKAK